MRDDDDLRTSLAAVEGDPPSPEFLASLFTEVEAERDRVRGGEDHLPEYAAGPVVDAWASTSPTPEAHPRARWPWGKAGVALVAAAIVLIVGFVVVQTGEDGSQVATRLPHGYAASDLPAAIVQGGDPHVTIGSNPATGLDPVVPPSYSDERSAIDSLDFVAGLTAPFDLAVPGAEQDCVDLRREIRTPLGHVSSLPCGGSSSALLFADDVDAAEAFEVITGFLEARSAGVYGLGVVLERAEDLEAPLGDEAEGFVLEEFVHAKVRGRVVVVVWRTDNLVQVLWDIQHGPRRGGAEALLDAAEIIEHRTSAERQIDGG